MTRYAYTTSPRPLLGIGTWDWGCTYSFDDDLETERGIERTFRTDLVRRLRPGDEIVTQSVWMIFGERPGAEALLRSIIVERQTSIRFHSEKLTLGPCSPDEFAGAFAKLGLGNGILSIDPRIGAKLRHTLALRGRVTTRGFDRTRKEVPR